MPAQTIADDILKLAKRRELSLTPMQLMKLVYISYGWYLAMNGNRLFDDKIEAWKYGPVIPSLYHATKHFRGEVIPGHLVSDAPVTRPDLEAFLGSIVDNYGQFSGIALSNLTHRPGTPWQRVFRHDVMGIEIPDDYIREHYQQGLNERQSSTTAAS